MRELSIFADESGDKTNHDRYFLLTLVVHDQAESIARFDHLEFFQGFDHVKVYYDNGYPNSREISTSFHATPMTC